jgi:outer membrane protein OmpA-like peptidoglycan-associated protein
MFNDKKSGYITSNRANNGVTDDIFEFKLIDLFVDLQLAYVVKDKNSGEAIGDVSVKVVEDSTGIILFQGSTDELGYFLQTMDSIPLNAVKKLKISMEKDGYVSKEVEFSITAIDTNKINVADLVDLNLEPLSIDMIINELLGLKSIYYDFDKADLRQDAIIELDKVVAFMNKHAKIDIELGSHTDCRGPKVYNLDLSNRRAMSAASYVKARISNPDRILFKGYGETMMKVDCPCEGRIRSKCSEEENQLNRRTEFTIKSLNITTGVNNVKPKVGVALPSEGNRNFTFNVDDQADFRITPVTEENEGLIFRVQVEASAVQIANATVKYNTQDVYEYQQENSYKYCLGGAFKTLKEAVAYQDKVRQNGYAQAFVIAFDQGKRITIEQAKKLIKE